MKKLLFFLIAAVCLSFTAMANTDTSGVIVRGEGGLTQYKKILSMEASHKILRAINSAIGEDGYMVLDLTPDVYEFYNLKLSDYGPTDSKILNYVNNLNNNIYDYKVTYVYDMVQLDGKTYVTVRAISCTGAEIASASRNGQANNLEELIDLFAPVTSEIIAKLSK